MANSFQSKGESLFQPKFVARWLRMQPRHPDSFDCGVRVTSGDVAGEAGRWDYRLSAADPLVLDGIVSLTHGKQLLRLAVDPATTPVPDAQRARQGFVNFPAVEQASGGTVEVSVMEYELERFGL